jgi:hypothetical protein
MKLYTITATPYHVYNSEADNKKLVEEYPKAIANVARANGIDGYTLYKVDGVWQGYSEPSFKIEIATEDVPAVIRLCHDLREIYNQDAVMLTNPDNTVVFIEATK